MRTAASPSPSWLDRAARAATAWPWPNRCAVCRSDTAGASAMICGACIDRHAPTVPRCHGCALRVPAGALRCGACLRLPPPWSRAIAACDYAYPWDGLLAAFKFHAALDLAPALAARLAEQVQAAGDPAVDLLLPVPLAPARLRERGYNQAAVLAAQVARRLGVSSAPRWLLRLRDTPHQIALPRERRAANVRDAFAVEPLAIAGLRGLRVALVDDVMTTGATLRVLAEVLRQAGCAEVQAWVFARTPE